MAFQPSRNIIFLNRLSSLQAMPPFVPRKRPISPVTTPEARPSKRAATAKSAKQKPTLFDTLDQASTSTQTVEDTKAYLQSRIKDEDSSSSSLSDAESDEFEDVLPAEGTRKALKVAGEDEDEDQDHWEDALSPAPLREAPADQVSAAPLQDLQITIGAHDGPTIANYNEEIGKKGPTKIERQIRIATHCLHVQFLLWHNVIRNGWACDKKVQDTLLQQLPQGIWKEVERWRAASGLDDNTNGAELDRESKAKCRRSKENQSTKTKKNRDWGESAEQLQKGVPNMVAGDPLLRLLKYVAAYWKKRFKVTALGLRKQGYKPIPVLEQEIKKFHNGTLPERLQGERIRNVDEFRSLAKKCQGSRDVGAQLFTALLRGFGLEARLVANLQPAGFGWGKNEDALLDKDSFLPDAEEDEYKLQDQNRPKAAGQNSLAGESPRKSSKAKGPENPKNVVILDSDSSSDLSSVNSDDVDSATELTMKATPRTDSVRIDKDLPFPHYWTEVLSPISNTYIPVDPLVLCTVAGTPDLVSSFEPRGAKADKAKEVIAYVIAHSADGSAKDVTVRYLKRRMLPGKTKGVRLPPERVPIYNKRGKIRRYEQYDWFKTVMSGYARWSKNRTIADELEESTDLRPSQPEQRKKAADETLQGYKNSAEFVLERHLKREEALLPNAKPVRTFTSGKGEKLKSEPVYRRADVVQCKSVETWHKEGREIKPGEQPLKLVPTRAVTLMRKREIEEAERDSGEKVKQGLYTRSQTKFIIPPTIENGIIPKNAFGNIDIYVPTMVPSGAVHIPRRGTVKICKRLGINYAEACIGFEFGNKRAVPILHGVVIPVEHERALLDAWEAERIEIQKKEEMKREQLILTTWKKFCKGLQILSRMEESYGQDANSHVPDELNPWTNRKLDASRKEQGRATEANGFVSTKEDKEAAGGFFRDGEELEETGGGGFIVDDDFARGNLLDNEKPSLNEERGPVSLQTAHQNYVDDKQALESREDDNGDEEIDKNDAPKSNGTKKLPKAAARASLRNEEKSRSRGKAKRKSRAAAEQGYRSSSDEEQMDINPPASGDEKNADFDVEVAIQQHPSPSSSSSRSKSKANSNRQSANSSVRKAPRRVAARKSQEAVRSHYFEHSSDDD